MQDRWAVCGSVVFPAAAAEGQPDMGGFDASGDAEDAGQASEDDDITVEGEFREVNDDDAEKPE